MKYLIFFSIVLSNYWFWRILKHNFLVALLLLLITFLLFITIKKRYYLLIFATITIASILVLILIRSDFDKTLFLHTQEEIHSLNQRRSYYPKNIGAIFQNKFNLSLYKFKRNIFANLDLNMYFFANHPRERGNISDFEKFSPFLIPAFIIGMLLSIKNKNQILLSYFLFSLLISGIFSINSYLGPIFFFVLICILSSQGIAYVIFKLISGNR